MAIPKKRREWITKLAEGGIFDDLPEDEFDELTDDDQDRPFREFLASVTDPAELHLFAQRFNWDGDVDDLRRVVRHPLCDLGTALLIYWRGQPGFYLEYADRNAVPAFAREVYDLLREIEGMVAAGRFKAATQPFDPANDEGTDLRPNRSVVKQHGRDVPAAMYRTVRSV